MKSLLLFMYPPLLYKVFCIIVISPAFLDKFNDIQGLRIFYSKYIFKNYLTLFFTYIIM
nr:MAG TPA: hypothetical protein [Bacteriophage sp.]